MSEMTKKQFLASVKIAEEVAPDLDAFVDERLSRLFSDVEQNFIEILGANSGIVMGRLAATFVDTMAQSTVAAGISSPADSRAGTYQVMLGRAARALEFYQKVMQDEGCLNGDIVRFQHDDDEQPPPPAGPG